MTLFSMTSLHVDLNEVAKYVDIILILDINLAFLWQSKQS